MLSAQKREGEDALHATYIALKVISECEKEEDRAKVVQALMKSVDVLSIDVTGTQQVLEVIIGLTKNALEKCKVKIG